MKIRVNSTQTQLKDALDKLKCKQNLAFLIAEAEGDGGGGGWVMQNLKNLTPMHRQYG